LLDFPPREVQKQSAKDRKHHRAIRKISTSLGLFYRLNNFVRAMIKKSLDL
jgi:hypothetical protein